jgi:hypothetical protein
MLLFMQQERVRHSLSRAITRLLCSHQQKTGSSTNLSLIAMPYPPTTAILSLKSQIALTMGKTGMLIDTWRCALSSAGVSAQSTSSTTKHVQLLGYHLVASHTLPGMLNVPFQAHAPCTTHKVIRMPARRQIAVAGCGELFPGFLDGNLMHVTSLRLSSSVSSCWSRPCSDSVAIIAISRFSGAVIEGWWNGRSRTCHVNIVFRRIHARGSFNHPHPIC